MKLFKKTFKKYLIVMPVLAASIGVTGVAGAAGATVQTVNAAEAVSLAGMLERAQREGFLYTFTGEDRVFDGNRIVSGNAQDISRLKASSKGTLIVRYRTESKNNQVIFAAGNNYQRDGYGAILSNNVRGIGQQRVDFPNGMFANLSGTNQTGDWHTFIYSVDAGNLYDKTAKTVTSFDGSSYTQYPNYNSWFNANSVINNIQYLTIGGVEGRLNNSSNNQNFVGEIAYIAFIPDKLSQSEAAAVTAEYYDENVFAPEKPEPTDPATDEDATDPGAGGGDTTDPATGGDTTDPDTGDDTTDPTTGVDITDPDTGGDTTEPTAGEDTEPDEPAEDDTKTELARPRVYINSFVGDITSKEDLRFTTLTFVDKNGEEKTYPVRVKIQGHSSLSYYKKNYNITFYKDDSYAKKNKITTALGKQNKWTLKANWIDKSHARNIVAARLAADINERYGVFDGTANHGVIDGFPVELYNNGQFWGIYTWNLAKGKWIYGVDDSVTGQVVIGANEWTWATAMAEEIKDFDEASGWEVEEGNYDAETVAGFNRLVRFINDSSDAEFKEHFSEYMNKDAAINYLLMLHLANAIDNTNKNVMLVTYDNGKVWAPVLYDMDVTFGTYWDGSKMRYDFNPVNQTDFDSTHPQMVNKLWGRLTKNFGDEISEKYFSLRKDIFSYDYILNRFKEFTDSVGDEGYELDRSIWPYQPGYGISQIEEYLSYKLPALDSYMASVAAGEADTASEPAKQGFVNENGAVYYYENGSKVLGQKQIGNDWYMFDLKSGRMQTGWYQHTWESEKEGPKKVYYDAEGRMLKGYQKIGSYYYYLDPGTGAMRTGYVLVNGRWIYFGSSGRQGYYF